jgi:membrane fusion protein, heavy metal efflux system
LAFPDRMFDAKLTCVAPPIDPNTHRLPVHAEIENPNHELKPEMFARFHIITGQGTAAPGVPASAAVYEADTAHVWLANVNARILAIRLVTLGRSGDGIAETLSELSGRRRRRLRRRRVHQPRRGR